MCMSIKNFNLRELEPIGFIPLISGWGGGGDGVGWGWGGEGKIKVMVKVKVKVGTIFETWNSIDVFTFRFMAIRPICAEV